MGKLGFERLYLCVAKNFDDGACHLTNDGGNGGVVGCDVRDGSHGGEDLMEREGEGEAYQFVGEGWGVGVGGAEGDDEKRRRMRRKWRR